MFGLETDILGFSVGVVSSGVGFGLWLSLFSDVVVTCTGSNAISISN